MGYEMWFEEFERIDILYECFYSVMEESKVGDIRLFRFNIGIEVVYIVVDIVIN